MSDTMRGYKAFDTDETGGLCCRDMAYEVGHEYALDGVPVLCERGYHFCTRLIDCFVFYPSADSRICEVEASGTIITGDDGKSVTDHIRIIRELDRSEVLGLANVGRGCTGVCNSGDCNSGYGNSGYRNSGDRNSGDRNSGDCNSGDCNSGYGNSGYRNSGYRNSGDRNSGDCNSGDCNSGYGNSGYCNSGYGNSGDWNITNCSSGVLCTQEPECLIFDRPSGMTLCEWRDSEAAELMDGISIDTDRWIDADDMTDEEKAAHPDFAITDGCLRRGTGKPDFAGWWKRLNDDERAVILAMPNFDPEKWKLITGIEVATDAR